MSGIGIDLNATLCRVVVRESDRNGPSYHHVTDGVRRAIPLLASASGGWGSDVEESDSGAGRETNRLFWQALRARLCSHLGGLRPDPRDGNRTTVALEGRGLSDDADELSAVLAGIEFEHCALITPSEAVLAAWMDATASGTARAPGAVVVGIAVGESSIEVRGIRLDGQGRVEAASQRSRLGEAGHGVWRGHLRSLLFDRLTTPPPLAIRLAVDDSILDFARRLARSGAHDEVQWNGAIAGQLFAPLVIQPEETRRWPQVQVMEIGLPERVSACLRELGGNSTAVVVVGGIGAQWPFVHGCLRSRFRVQTPPECVDLVARGAAAWPEVKWRVSGCDPGPSTLRAPAAALPSPGGGAPGAPAPPWLRAGDPFAARESDDE